MRWTAMILVLLCTGCMHSRVCVVASTELDGVRYEARWEGDSNGTDRRTDERERPAGR
jgi:hypothetical protein